MSELNNLIDLIDGFAAAKTFDERWKVANQVTFNMGGIALNIAEVDSRTGAAKWISSSMTEEWMTRYVNEEYYACDAVLDHCLTSFDTCYLSTGARTIDPSFSDHARRLDGDLYDYGYKSFLAGSHIGNSSSNRIATSMVGDLTNLRLIDPDIEKSFQRVSAVISSFIGSPLDQTSEDVYFIDRRPLTARERDVLSMLANGHLNSRIAEQLGIAEVTVRMHIKSAREKMGAATREQAIALAVRDGLISI